MITRTIVADGVVAGNIGSWPDDSQQLVGYWVGRAWWGRGVATQALTLLLDKVSIRPLYAHVAKHNIGSIRVLDKCGFRRDSAQDAKHLRPTTASRRSSSCWTPKGRAQRRPANPGRRLRGGIGTTSLPSRRSGCISAGSVWSPRMSRVIFMCGPRGLEDHVRRRLESREWSGSPSTWRCGAAGSSVPLPPDVRDEIEAVLRDHCFGRRRWHRRRAGLFVLVAPDPDRVRQVLEPTGVVPETIYLAPTGNRPESNPGSTADIR